MNSSNTLDHFLFTSLVKTSFRTLINRELNLIYLAERMLSTENSLREQTLRLN